MQSKTRYCKWRLQTYNTTVARLAKCFRFHSHSEGPLFKYPIENRNYKMYNEKMTIRQRHDGYILRFVYTSKITHHQQFCACAVMTSGRTRWTSQQVIPCLGHEARLQYQDIARRRAAIFRQGVLVNNGYDWFPDHRAGINHRYLYTN